MARRRRYDTEALVGRMRAERRTGIILSLAGVLILAFLLTLYITGIGAEEEVPKVPNGAAHTPVTEVTGNATATSGTTGTAGGAGANPSSKDPPKDPPTADSEQKPAQVSVALSKKGEVWVDDEKFGKVKNKVVELKPGTHEIKAKIGKKTLSYEIEIKGGEQLEVAFDPKKKQPVIRELGSGETVDGGGVDEDGEAADEKGRGKKKKKKGKAKRKKKR